MTLREILQIELWSKQTTRKILGRLWRVLKPVTAVLGSAVVLLLLVYVIEARWLTSGERQSGTAALAAVEKLEGLCYCRCEQFAAANEEAKKAVQDARAKAWTLRDHELVEWLEFYRVEVEDANDGDLGEALIANSAAERHQQLHLDPKHEAEGRASNAKLFSLIRDGLRKVLD
jgi:hypothetical protein